VCPYFRFHRGLIKELCRIAHRCLAKFQRVPPRNREDMVRLAQYIIRNPFSVDKMQPSISGDSIIYRSGMNPKIQRNFEVFSPCDFIGRITQHIPDKSFQLVRHYGWYSNKMRGYRLKWADAEVVDAPGGEVIDVSAFKPRRKGVRKGVSQQTLTVFPALDIFMTWPDSPASNILALSIK